MANGIDVLLKCKVKDGAILPIYKTDEASGADVCAFIESDVTLMPGDTKIIPTGVFLEIPPKYEVQVRPRSGLAANNSITVVNTPGTIDSDYRGEIKIILINLGKEPFTVHNHDRIAQLVVAPVLRAEFLQVSELNQTERGEKGFGSTGVSSC